MRSRVADGLSGEDVELDERRFPFGELFGDDSNGVTQDA
jgi:hypothetical protein